jgi:hypothetical protein
LRYPFANASECSICGLRGSLSSCGDFSKGLLGLRIEPCEEIALLSEYCRYAVRRCGGRLRNRGEGLLSLRADVRE